MAIFKNISSQNISFADKFSKLKMRFLLVFWLVLSIFIINLTSSLIYTLYSITKIQDSYYSITIKNDEVFYSRTLSIPPGWLVLSKISKRLQQAIIVSEDGLFYLHAGYDLEQLRGALKDSFVLKKKMRGASTITQQLAKNLFLSRDKTFGRKGQELILSIMIEKYADKQKILESYLNIIEYGKNLYGIDQAAHFYFNKNALNLTARESAFIAMLLPSPVKYAKSFQKKSLTAFAKRIIDSILLKMRQAGYISESEYQEQLVSRFSWEKTNNEPSTEIFAEESGNEFELIEGE